MFSTSRRSLVAVVLFLWFFRFSLHRFFSFFFVDVSFFFVDVVFRFVLVPFRSSCFRFFIHSFVCLRAFDFSFVRSFVLELLFVGSFVLPFVLFFGFLFVRARSFVLSLFSVSLSFCRSL
jgi:hypothetical protein